MNGLPVGCPRFVTIEDALGWHAMAIARYGGCREAEQAMPFLAAISEGYSEASPETQEVARELYKTFAALYRIAEDMGYEW